MSELPRIVKDYRVAVAEHVLCPGPDHCDHDHAASERRAAEALRSALGHSAALAKALESLLNVHNAIGGTRLQAKAEARDAARAALAAYEAEKGAK